MKFLPIILASLITPLLAVQAASADIGKIKAQIKQALPGIQVTDVAETPIPGLYQVSTPGSINYLSADGRYLLTGDLIDQKEGINVTESLKGEIRKKRIENLGDDRMVVYKAEGKEKHAITVFTDTSCGYCRKLHLDIPQLNKDGITVKYLLYPRSGPNSASANVMESVWCAKDSLKAMDDAKSNKSVPSKKCDNPIMEHLRIGQEFGLRGTPMIVTQTGDILPGYYPPATLKAKIGLN